MSSFRNPLLAVAALLLAGSALAQSGNYPGIGRPATAKEVAAWDIDVRPDFKGLPRGAGSVAKGMEVWEGKCASCHGIFGESNEVFSPLVGGTTKEDVASGRVGRLLDRAYPGRTTLMKVSSISTLWDYINRAMPWAQPKSLTVEEVYGVTAYLLNMGGVIPETFTLSDRNIADVQKLLPNRAGMTTDHGLWPGKTLGNGGKPDVVGTACMKDCATEPKVTSFLPDFARDAHGNLAEQSRLVGAQRGADTTRPANSTMAAAVVTTSRPTEVASTSGPATALALARKANCMVCHGLDNKIVGPALADVAKKYAGRSDTATFLAQKIQAGSTGVWGVIPMPPQSLSAADAKAIAQWLAEGMKK